jgi:hypothetical protein
MYAHRRHGKLVRDANTVECGILSISKFYITFIFKAQNVPSPSVICASEEYTCTCHKGAQRCYSTLCIDKEIQDDKE